MAVVESAPRRRSTRAQKNDQAIRDAAIAEVLRVGVDRVSLRDVGLRAGLTHGATYARYEEVDELLVDLWNQVLETRLRRLYELAMTAANEPTETSVYATATACASATVEDVCAVHLLVAAHRIPILQEETERFVGECLRGEDCSSDDVNARFTRGLSLFSLMIARITADHHFGSDNESLFAISGVILDALRTDPAGVTQISLHVPQSPFILPEGEDLRTQLMASTIQVIGKAGYVKATMSRIARRASCSPGAIYKLFPSKEELVVVTYSEALKSRWIPLDQFTTFLDEGVLAQFLHDVTSVENTNQRNFVLEFGMAATNVEALAPAILAHANEMYELLPHLQLATEGEQRLLESMIRLFNHLTMGATMLAVASNAFQCSNFSQFAEPFRLAILARVGETWRNLSRHLLAYDSPRPEERDAIFRASPPTLPAA